MKPRRRTVVVASVLATAAALFWWLRPAPDPIFRGKPESAWIEGIEYNGDDAQTEMWRSFGPDGVQVLIRGIHRADQPLKRFYRRVYGRAGRWLPLDLVRFLPSPAPVRNGGSPTTIIDLLSSLDRDAKLAAASAVATTLRSEFKGVRHIAIGFFNDTEDENALLNRIEPKLKRRLLPEFIRAVQDPDHWGLRNNAALALRYYPEEAQVVAPVLVKALGDSAPQVRLLAAVALNHIAPEQARQSGAVLVVAKITKEPDDQVASRAAGALCEFQAEPDIAVPALVEALRSTNTLVACSAIWSLEAAFADKQELFLPALREAALRDDVAGQRAKKTLERLESTQARTHSVAE